jgi:hypothetical protein
LALRALRKNHAIRVLEHILKWDPLGIEEYFYSNHYFVMKFIGEQGSWLNNAEFVKKQIDDFLNYSCEYWKIGGALNFNVFEKFKDWYKKLTDPFVRSTVTDKLFIRIESGDEFWRDINLDLVGLYAGKSKTVADKLFEMATLEKISIKPRIRCITAACKVGPINEIPVDWLRKLAEDESQDIDLRVCCAESLGKHEQKESGLNILLKIIENDTQKEDVLKNAAEAIGRIGEKELAINLLTKYAEDNQYNLSFRKNCANSAWELSMNIKDLVRYWWLEKRYSDYNDIDQWLFYYLKKLRTSSRTQISQLISLGKDENQSLTVLLGCALVLEELNKGNDAKPIWLKQAENKKNSDEIRFECARSLFEHGKKEKGMKIMIDIYKNLPDKKSKIAVPMHDYLWSIINMQSGKN